MGATMAPAFQAPIWPITACGQLGITSATRSPFCTPSSRSAAAKRIA